MSDSAKLTSSPAWTALLAHYEATKDVQMKDMFASDKERFNKFNMEFEDMLIDFSKNRINEETMKLLYGLAKQQDVSGLAKKMFAGEKISKSYNNKYIIQYYCILCSPHSLPSFGFSCLPIVLSGLCLILF
jgi:hypothetical protein